MPSGAADDSIPVGERTHASRGRPVALSDDCTGDVVKNVDPVLAHWALHVALPLRFAFQAPLRQGHRSPAGQDLRQRGRFSYGRAGDQRPVDLGNRRLTRGARSRQGGAWTAGRHTAQATVWRCHEPPLHRRGPIGHRDTTKRSRTVDRRCHEPGILHRRRGRDRHVGVGAAAAVRLPPSAGGRRRRQLRGTARGHRARSGVSPRLAPRADPRPGAARAQKHADSTGGRDGAGRGEPDGPSPSGRPAGGG
jgi:hypothetical protein